MRYVRTTDEAHARRLVNFDSCGNISITGSVRGMQNLFGWPKGGQVRLGAWVYNVGVTAVATLRNHRLLCGEG